MIGEVLGNRYEIQEKIGEGGMSIVYKARCNKLNRYVAVKILKKELSDNEEIVTKFKREATAIAALSDNNIVNVLDVGTQDDLNYIVMEYVKGKTLKDVIKQFGKLNYETAITIGTQIAKALECAHKNNIIHRDVKPQNVLVTEEGVIKVTDFGIAKSASSATLTNTTTIMGSAHYFSPEQARGSFIDVRTDLYSFGVVLYEMVTGKLPFEADSPVTIALKHIQEEVVPPKQLNSKIPESLNKLILKAMDKDANKRYQTAREIIVDLQKIKDDPDSVIDSAEDNDGTDHTIVMAPVKVPEKPSGQKESINKSLEDDYYEDEEDDEYYDDEYDDEDDEKKGKKKMNKKLITSIVVGIAVFLALGLGAFFIFSGGSSSDKGDVSVPDIKGMTKEEAKSALEKEGLVYEEAGTENSDEPEGTVISYSPSNQMVKKGSKVRVILSKGQKKLKMEEFAGDDLDALNSFLTKNKMAAATVTNKHSDTVPEGKIISTDPAAGADIDASTKVSVVISDGPEVKKTTVPSLKGKTRDEAVALLTRANLKVDVTFDDSDEKNNGKVIATSHPEGMTVPYDTTVTITIGRYTKPQEPEKPEFDLGVLQKGMTLQGVERALGGKVKYTIKGPKDGILEDWNPKGSVKEGSTVELTFIPKPVTEEDKDK
ncbi:Stk1 family PASTA domain-containing Ser/Thr kinase [Clostridium paraputrificum]|uniref:Stk1 family PASTA domain-containing Ser/Thr kinase n=1 Tax=Clostridium paraputrificum TaxID=29363 RepID=UPI003D330110